MDQHGVESRSLSQIEATAGEHRFEAAGAIGMVLGWTIDGGWVGGQGQGEGGG